MYVLQIENYLCASTPPPPRVDTCDTDFKICAMEKRKNVCLEIIYGQINHLYYIYVFMERNDIDYF